MKTLYFNGDILTMNSSGLYAEAVLTEDGKILAVGSRTDLTRNQADTIIPVDLQGKTLMPGFIDAHSHFINYATNLTQADLTDCRSFSEIKERIRSFMAETNPSPGQWVKAACYDHTGLSERTHPPLAFLDEICPDNPLCIWHQSGHVGLFNSLGLAALGITDDTPQIPGGLIAKDEAGHLSGYMEENAFVEYTKRIPMADNASFLSALRKAQDAYLQRGITTVQEGMVVDLLIPVYQYLINTDFFRLDYVGYADVFTRDKILQALPRCNNRYDHHVRIGGYKIFLDGSPQARTAYMLEPYKGESEYRGYPSHTGDEVDYACLVSCQEKMQLLAHCNGDAACQQFMDSYEKALAVTGNDIRPVIVHAQLMRPSQMEQAKRLGMMPSFFVSHVYHWGDIHIENFGLERASQISSVNSALKQGLPFTFHTDAPVIQPDILECVWCAVNRITKSGVCLGPEERVDVLDALKAVTIYAAYQYGEEDRKGSIEPGKLADFVILDRNPLKTDKMAIRDIEVLATIKEDKVLYSRQPR